MTISAERDVVQADFAAALSAIPGGFVAEADPRRTTEQYRFYTFTASSVGFRGSGSYRIGGYLSIPTAAGPHPAVLELPRHGSVNHTPHSNERSRYIVLTLMHRGQRGADVPFRAPYPGLLTLDIETDWVMRGVAADAARGLELLRAVDGVDQTRVGIVGDDISLLVAARDADVAAVRVDSILLTKMWERAALTRAYPLEELNDLRRSRPEDADTLPDLGADLDPLLVAPGVRAEVLLSAGPTDPAAAALVNALPRATLLAVTGQDRLDDDARDDWLANRLGVRPLSRFLDAAVPL
ncbi:cephalosporin-C deacetylase-like acetyl esterase [Microbacterium sp. AG1240]|uniref:acetylxylan esterase n=1 Tax=Microbacterium sp. AG1240 TaxID=2183992 RepID=UPI000EB2311A|nr:acetylxylan esterase [Microbacterium sp. AG1240]RKT31620.1 cephalosporin-C deacetylase-like acetyl esterase [Microbacterium sp. AG1240]